MFIDNQIVKRISIMELEIELKFRCTFVITSSEIFLMIY